MDYKKLIAKTINIQNLTDEEIMSMLALPKDRQMGDFCLPCFKFAKELRKSPMIVAKEIADNTPQLEFLEKAEAVAGYVNYKLNKTLLAQRVLEKILEEKEGYGCSLEGNGKTICIDYSSINIAKPFHMGHLLNTVIGGALYRIFKAIGYNVIGINHLGDWGTQFGKLIVAYKLWGDKCDIENRGVKGLLDIYVRFHKEAQENKELDEQARSWFKKIEDGDKDALELFYWFKEITLKEVSKIYDRLNVQFDSFAGESFYNDKMQPVLQDLRDKRLLEYSDGAQVVKFENDKMPPCLLVRADGATLYATRDMAAAFYRKATYNFDKCLYVVAYQQNLHFQQIFEVLKKMGCDWANDMHHIAHGMVSLEDGALSTRQGNVVFLEDVLNMSVSKSLKVIEEKNPNLENKQQIAEQIGVGAVIFGVLFNNRIKDMVFSYDKVLNFEGETGPYVQYTYARCNSLIEKAGESDGSLDFAGIINEQANDLISLLSRYPNIVEEAAHKFEPSILTRHLINIAQTFNKFYFEHNIINAPAPIKNARVMLAKATRQVISNALGLLGIGTPYKM